MRAYSILLLALTSVAFAACSESDVVSLRITLAEDGSGTIATSCLLRPKDKGPLENQSSGAEWLERANLYCTKGTFKSFSQLKIADLSFALGNTPDGICYARVTLPAGKAAQWCTAMAPAPNEQRLLSGTLDPTGKVLSAGSVLKLEIEIPGFVAGVGIAPELRGAAADKTKDRALLIIPIRRVLEETTATSLSFDVTWKKK